MKIISELESKLNKLNKKSNEFIKNEIIAEAWFLLLIKIYEEEKKKCTVNNNRL